MTKFEELLQQINRQHVYIPVSYTHLTLPTNREVEISAGTS